jgi:hypothetical protein
MGSSLSSAITNISTKSSKIDHIHGIKEEQTTENGIYYKRRYKKDKHGDWILINEQVDELKGIADVIGAFDSFVNISNVRVGNVHFKNKPHTSGTDCKDPQGTYRELFQSKLDLTDYQKIDLVKRYQEKHCCLPLDKAMKLAQSFKTKEGMIMLYETVIKCASKR